MAYGVKNLFAHDRCPKCKGSVMLVWTSEGRTFQCTSCKDALAKQLYIEPSGSEGEEK